jgi:light-regulated signal transduction histidine kinase (bacteriophytochrome)
MPGTPPSSTGTQVRADPCVHLDFDSLHDLTGPVSQLCSMVDLIRMKHGVSLGVEAETLFGFVQTSAHALQNLVAGLRMYARVIGAPIRWQICDMNAILSASISSVRPAIEATGAAVSYNDLPELYGDANQLTYAFAGLIDNAIKFRGSRPPEIHIAAVHHADGCVFSIRDNGLGIAPGYHERIFAVFKRIHNDAYPGAGVGLPIIKRIMELHGGAIWFESDPGQGATFFLALPSALRAHSNQER